MVIRISGGGRKKGASGTFYSKEAVFLGRGQAGISTKVRAEFSIVSPKASKEEHSFFWCMYISHSFA
jgi:hypothetical protein